MQALLNNKVFCLKDPYYVHFKDHTFISGVYYKVFTCFNVQKPRCLPHTVHFTVTLHVDDTTVISGRWRRWSVEFQGRRLPSRRPQLRSALQHVRELHRIFLTRDVGISTFCKRDTTGFCLKETSGRFPDVFLATKQSAHLWSCLWQPKQVF